MVAIGLQSTRATVVRSALVAVCAGAGLSACASIAPMPEGLASTQGGQGAAPAHASVRSASAQNPAQSGPRYKLGAPYQAGGVWYVPAEQPNYDEVGLASWYGDEFNGKPTADGELFDMNGISAAHATLPMPSIVEVTNLENGRTIRVRLNDRGPFHPGRIIDLSRGAAQQLGFFNKGTAQVRVRFVSVAPLAGSGGATMIAANPMQAVLPPISAPSPEAPINRPPVSANAALSAGFTVQAGAFSDRANAERVALRLAAAGRAAVSPLDRNGSRLYRVTVGSWSSADDAGQAQRKVVSLGFSDARVMPGS
jgi:rare lipoprotein A